MTEQPAESESGQESPPSAGLMVSWFVVPGLIVTLLVASCVAVAPWMRRQRTAEELVDRLESWDRASHQDAVTLAKMLRDQQSIALRSDGEVASRLAEALQRQLADEPVEPERLLLCQYLCLCLGRFEVTDGLDALLEALAERRASREIEIRRAAAWAIALLAENCSPEAVRRDDRVAPALIAATDDNVSSLTGMAGPEDQRQHALRQHRLLRETATFALGIVGGERAVDHLALLLDDSTPNVRYNAAVGLARQGDPRAIKAIVQMLDPGNHQAMQLETTPEGRAAKRELVVVNALRVVAPLLTQADAVQREELRAAVARLTQADVAPAIRSEAQRVASLFD